MASPDQFQFTLSPESSDYDRQKTAHLAEVRRMISQGGFDPNREIPGLGTPLQNACATGPVEVVRLLLDAGAIVDKKPVKVGPWKGLWPLHLAAEHGDPEIVRLLVERGAPVDIPQAFARTMPLHKAIENGHIEIVRFLVERGANVNRKAFGGRLPIEMTTDDAMKAVLQQAGGGYTQPQRVDVSSMPYANPSSKHGSRQDPRDRGQARRVGMKYGQWGV